MEPASWSQRNDCQLPDSRGVGDAMTGCPCAEGQRLKERRSCVSAARSLCCVLALSLRSVFCFVLETGSHFTQPASTCALAAPSRACWNCGHIPRPLPYNSLLTSSEMVTTRNLGRRYMGILCDRKMIHKFKISK